MSQGNGNVPISKENLQRQTSRKCQVALTQVSDAFNDRINVISCIT